MRKSINLMISTNPCGQGGIATVVSGLQDGDFFQKEGFLHIASHSSKNGNNLTSVLYFLFALVKVVYYNFLYNVEITHVHMASRGSYERKSRILKLARFFNSKTIIHLHGGEFKKFFDDECSAQKKIEIAKTFNDADRILVLSSQWLSWVNTLVSDSNKVSVLYNSVPDMNTKSETSNEKSILFLGRLEHQKGVEELIHAFSLIAPKFENAVLNLAGEGDLEKYQSLVHHLKIDSKVNFLGWISGIEKAEYLSKATIYCLPSYNEGFPMGVLEAMSARTPVIATRVGGIPDAITDRKDGLLVEPGDIKTLSESIEILLEDPELCIDLANKAKSKFQSNFSRESVLPILTSIYKELKHCNE